METDAVEGTGGIGVKRKRQEESETGDGGGGFRRRLSSGCSMAGGPIDLDAHTGSEEGLSKTTENSQQRSDDGSDATEAAERRASFVQNNTQEEREEIARVLRGSLSLAAAMETLSKTVPKVDTKNAAAPAYLSRFTLRKWFEHPERLMRTLARARVPPSPGSGRRRAAPEGSVRRQLSEESRDIIGRAADSSASLTEFAQNLAISLPGFSQTDENAAMYVPRTTVRNWFFRKTVKSWFQESDEDETWEKERENVFGVLSEKPGKRKLPQMASTDSDGTWLRRRSWTYCSACGRRRPRTEVHGQHANVDAVACAPACDVDAWDLLDPPRTAPKTGKLFAYVTPVVDHWRALCDAVDGGQLPLRLNRWELEDLAVADIKVDYRSRAGGKSDVYSKQKRSVVRCLWRARCLYDLPRGEAADAVFRWLMENNSTYRAFVESHTRLVRDNAGKAGDWREVPTAELLLSRPGMEVAVRPWLYPLASMADTDARERLGALGWLKPGSKPSIRTSMMRKITSRCLDYARDFPLQCLIYDTCMARTISSVVNIAESKKVSPEQIASDMDTFQVYWQQQVEKMEDICRQEAGASGRVEDGLPTVFFTISPAEWRYVLHEGMFPEGDLSDQQSLLTLHLYHTLEAMLGLHLFKEGVSLARVGIAKVRQWSLRYEFQSRGTLHVHCLLWADLLPGWTAENVTARTGGKERSAFLILLEELFRSRADVQCGDGHHLLLQYVAGYVSKASDALTFRSKQAQHDGDGSRWRQVYRLLCKKSPLEQEMVMEMAGLSMAKHSFTGVSLFPPIPGSKAVNESRAHYNAFQQFLHRGAVVDGAATSMSYMQWLRMFRVVTTDGKSVVRPRNVAGPGRNKSCGIGIRFPFELLDIFVGAWAACFLENMLEARLRPSTEEDDAYPAGFDFEKARRRLFRAPEGCEHLKAVLCLDEFQRRGAPPGTFAPDTGRLIAAIEGDLMLRGLSVDRIVTFKARINACSLLLQGIRDGRQDPSIWSARRPAGLPQRQWSPEQAQVLGCIREGLRVGDAGVMADSRRVLRVTGGPGTGKTEVVIGAVQAALEDGCRVLVAGPIGLLMSMYKLRLPPNENLVMETIHAAFKVVRDADAQYIPPGRLRTFDLIILDEVSQIDAAVWNCLKIALGELRPLPFIVFVGDFQQLQPIVGRPLLQQNLEQQVRDGTVFAVELRQHEAARSADPVMLDFLQRARVRQPSRDALGRFFAGRIWPSDLNLATAKAKELEASEGGSFTFLTVTNKGAQDINMACLARDYPEQYRELRSGGGVPGQTGHVVVSPGMRLRLTHNVDKDRGFVNGAMGVVQEVLRKDVFVLMTGQQVPVLVHPITYKGNKYLPVSYGWATTIRRVQGATLDKVVLYFNRHLADRGYAYVGASRARRAVDVYLMGRIRRTDWLAVNSDQADEQTVLSALSDSSASDDDYFPSDPEADSSDPEPADSDFDPCSESESE